MLSAAKWFSFRIFLCLIIYLLFPLTAHAQTDAEDACPQIVADALELTDTVCEDTGLNEICYGYFVLEADPQADVQNFQFAEPGDIQPVVAVRSLRLSAMDTTQDIWGVALMQVAAALAADNPENVTLLLFGDVQIAPEFINEEYAPMQAFYFQSGKDDAPCAEAPNSGFLIQTPEGAAEVSFLINEVNIQANATAFLQAEPDGSMSVYVLDGSMTVEADGVEQALVAGTSLQIPLDADGVASGAPSAPEPYDMSVLNALPVELLDQPVDIALPLNASGTVPTSGRWVFSWNVTEMACPDGTPVSFETTVATTNLSVAADGSSINALLHQYNRVGAGAYRAAFTDGSGNLHTHTLTVTSLTTIAGQATIDYLDFDCTLAVPFSLRLVAPE